MCFHDRLRSFVFSDGNEIMLCPDCSFEKGHECLLLNTEHIKYTEAHDVFWETKLPSMGDGRSGNIDYCGDINNLSEMQAYLYEAINHTTPWLYKKKIKDRTQFNQVNPEDVDWSDRQKAFPHSQSMPRHYNNFCASCNEMVIDKFFRAVRITHGSYLPIDHQCDVVRVYDLAGKLLGVKSI